MKKKRADFFWRIAISTIGVILILMAVGNVMLFFFGETANASVSTRRYGGEIYGMANDKRYTWYVNYTFRADDGKVYEGNVTKRGSAISVSVSNLIYYFPFAPFLNTSKESAEPNLGQLAMIVVGFFCLIAINKNPKKSVVKYVKEPLLDYDDSIENIFNKEDIMSNFCSKCGASLSPNDHFCPSCGVALASTAVSTSAEPSETQNLPYVGWTTHHLDAEVIERAAKNKKHAWVFTLFLTLVFPVGFSIAGILMDDMPLNEAVIIGVCLGLLMLLIGIIRISKMKAGIWDGKVTDKRQKQKMDNSQDDGAVRQNTIYTIFVTEDGGKKHKLKYVNNAVMYDYFNIGDRIRCHLAFGTYEKFDKSKDSSIFCNICGKINDISQDKCKSCKLPLFK